VNKEVSHMSQKDANEVNNELLKLNILREINKNIKVLVLANRQLIETEKNNLLNSGDNKKILSLCNGKRQVKDIAKEIRKTPRAVQYAVEQLEVYGFVTLLKAPSGKAKLPKKL
jgi:hypothetical protein